jgi:hypothetical protein
MNLQWIPIQWGTMTYVALAGSVQRWRLPPQDLMGKQRPEWAPRTPQGVSRTPARPPPGSRTPCSHALPSNSPKTIRDFPPQFFLTDRNLTVSDYFSSLGYWDIYHRLAALNHRNTLSSPRSWKFDVKVVLGSVFSQFVMCICPWPFSQLWGTFWLFCCSLVYTCITPSSVSSSWAFSLCAYVCRLWLL